MAGDCVAIGHMHDVKSVLAIHSLSDGTLHHKVDLPIGSLAGFSGRRDYDDVYIKLTSFLEPGVVYHISNVKKSAELTTEKQTELAGDVDLLAFETKQLFYKSQDGTKIPMFVMHRKDLVLDGSNPTILYGYGGFNISLTPSFSISRLLWCQRFKGVYAVANIRGGGEYGLAWYHAGRRENKQNCFTDFQCAARFLADQKYTNASKLAIQGGSNGGLLVGACINQAPSLFSAAIAQVGVLDMYKFHKFTIGHAWTSDFGDPDIEAEFNVIEKYSPLHNIKRPPDDGSWQYPNVLVLTADHDDRVVPLHSLKFIAELQHTAGPSPGQKNPLLAKIDTKAGHGAGKPTDKVIDEVSHVFAYVAWATGAQAAS